MDNRKRVFQTLDGLRGVAAILVLARHLPDPTFLRLFPSSYLAVDLFFALSGFVIAHAYGARLRAGLGLGTFLDIRLVRLYPLYLLGTGLGVALFLATDPPDSVMLVPFSVTLWLNILLLPNLNGARAPAALLYPFDFPTWSILWEIVVNALYGAIAPRLGCRALNAILLMGAGLLVYSSWANRGLDSGVSFAGWTGGGQRVLFSFFAGVALHRLWVAGRLPWLRLPSWAAFVILLMLFAARPGEWRAAFDCFATLIAFPLLVFCATNEPPRWLRPFCARLGLASYAIYVLHAPLLGAAQALAWRLGRPLEALGWAPGVALAGMVMAIALAVDRRYDTPLRARLSRRLRGPGASRGRA